MNQTVSDILSIQERMLIGCVSIFEGLSGATTDPEALAIVAHALKAIHHNNAVIHAMIDSVNATKH